MLFNIPNYVESESPSYCLHNEYVNTWKSFFRYSNFIYVIDELVIIMDGNIIFNTQL
jgi:hypothetical protein